jgi:hypothetical protein
MIVSGFANICLDADTFMGRLFSTKTIKEVSLFSSKAKESKRF